MVDGGLSEENTPLTAAWYRRHTELYRANSRAMTDAHLAGRRIYEDPTAIRTANELEAHFGQEIMGGKHGRPCSEYGGGLCT